MSGDTDSVSRSPLSYYGSAIAAYRGDGTLTLEDGSSLATSFDAGQLSTGQCVILCGWPPHLFFSPSVSPLTFKGTTSEGYELRAEGGFMEVNYLPDAPSDVSNPASAAFRIHELKVRTKTSGTPASTRFGLTNLEMIGTSVIREPGVGDYLVLPLTLASSEGAARVALKPLRTKSETIRRLQVLKGTDVTCEAMVDLAAQSAEATLSTIENLCYLLSLARGTKIQWVYQDIYDDAGLLLSRLHASRITKPYGGLPVIHPWEEAGVDTKVFLETAYGPYVDKRERYRLDQGIIDAYLDAKAENDYLEMRGVKVAVVVEMLKDVFLAVPNTPAKEYILKEETFELLIPLMSEAIDQLLQNRGIGRDSRKAICGEKKVLGLNRTSFANVLRKLCKHIGIRPSRDLDLFVSCRNSLIHSGRFLSTVAPEDQRASSTALTSPKHEYFFLVNFLDKIFLKLSGYSGPYVDWRLPGGPTRREQVD